MTTALPGLERDGDELLGGRAAIVKAWRSAVARARQASAERRARVLAHPDLARRLTEPPLALHEPARWSGWIPPRLLAAQACPACNAGGPAWACRGHEHLAPVNDSPFRVQLVEIAAEAMRRDAPAEVDR